MHLRPHRVALLVALVSLLGWSSWARAADATEYDVIVIGGGPSGYAAALAARQKGAKRVLILEKRDGGSKGRVQTLLVEKSTVAQLAALGVEVGGAGSAFHDVKTITLHRDGKDDTVLRPRGSIESTEPAGPGAKTTGMFLKRNPVGFVAIDGVVETLRDAAAKTPGIDIVEGQEVVNASIRSTGEIDLSTAQRDDHGKPVHDATTAQFRGRYFYDASGLNGVAGLLGVEKIRQGPEYPMVTAVFRDDDRSHFGEAFFTHVDYDGASYRVLVGGGMPGETTVTFDLPPGVDRSSKEAISAFARRAASRSAFFGEGILPELVKEPSVYAAQRTNADRVLVGPSGSERGMIGGDARVTGTPWTGLGFNLSIHTGVLFGDFVERAESASSPQDASDARKWLRARAASQVAMLHTVDRVMHVATGAPQLQGARGKWALLGDLKASGKETASAVKAWSSYGASRLVHVTTQVGGPKVAPPPQQSHPVAPSAPTKR